jgi:hypothetical protein
MRRGVIAAGGVAVIKTLKSLTYRGDKTRAKYHSSKIFSGVFFECLVRFIETVKVVPIRTKQRDLQEPMLKKIGARKRKKKK